MKKLVWGILILGITNAIAAESIGLKDPTRPAENMGVKVKRLADQDEHIKNQAVDLLGRGHLRMIVLKKFPEKSWVIIGNKKFYVGDIVFGNFELTSIKEEGIYFKDVKQEYFLPLNKEQKIKTNIERVDHE